MSILLILIRMIVEFSTHSLLTVVKLIPPIFIQTFEEFLIDEIGTAGLDNISPLD